MELRVVLSPGQRTARRTFFTAPPGRSRPWALSTRVTSPACTCTVFPAAATSTEPLVAATTAALPSAVTRKCPPELSATAEVSLTWRETRPLPGSTSDSTLPRTRARSRPLLAVVTWISLRSCSLTSTPSTESSASPSAGVRRPSLSPMRWPEEAGLQGPAPRCSSTAPRLPISTAPPSGKGGVASARGVGVGAGLCLSHRHAGPKTARATESAAASRMPFHIGESEGFSQSCPGASREARRQAVAAPRLRGHRTPGAGARRAAAPRERRAAVAAPAALRAGRARAGARVPEDGARRPGSALPGSAHAAAARAGRRDAPTGPAPALQGDARRGRDGPLRREGRRGGAGRALRQSGNRGGGARDGERAGDGGLLAPRSPGRGAGDRACHRAGVRASRRERDGGAPRGAGSACPRPALGAGDGAVPKARAPVGARLQGGRERSGFPGGRAQPRHRASRRGAGARPDRPLQPSALDLRSRRPAGRGRDRAALGMEGGGAAAGGRGAGRVARRDADRLALGAGGVGAGGGHGPVGGGGGHAAGADAARRRARGGRGHAGRLGARRRQGRAG